MYKVIVHDIGTEKTVWLYETIASAAKFVADLHKNYQTFLKLEPGKDYEIELIEL